MPGRSRSTGVANPGKMTVGEMKTLAVETVVCVLQCSGNGRAFFDHETSGSQWSVGAAGNVVWTRRAGARRD